jgi:trk system potassium uptake protein TrkH
MKAFFRRIATLHPIKALILGYVSLTVLGFIILSIPWAQTLSTPFIDNLFISASAVSTTGLATVSVSDNYNFFGELIVLLLIQVGGLGYMAFGSFIVLTTKRKLSEAHEEIIRNDFGLPKTFNLRGFIETVIIFTFLIEAVGAVGLFAVFKSSGIAHPIWCAIFHSVSAFCTAGFSLFNNSFEGFRDNTALNLFIFILSFLGAIGFIVVADLWQRFRGLRKEITLTSKIILGFTFLAIAVGWGLFLVTEPLFKGPWAATWMPALFQAMTAMTTVGFNTVPISSLSHGALYLLTILMIVGASPAGTGGGIKSTTVVAVLAETFATLRGKRIVTFLGRVIPDFRLQQASASFNFYIILLTLGIYLINLTDGKLFIFDIIFEATSAIGTVGLSTGITASLSFLGKCVVTCLMLLGRIGPLSIGLAIFFNKKTEDVDLWNTRYEDIIID